MAQQIVPNFKALPFGIPDSRRLGATLKFMAIASVDLAQAVVMNKWMTTEVKVVYYTSYTITGTLYDLLF